MKRASPTRASALLLCTGIAAGAVALLVTGSPLLLLPVPGLPTVPAGTPITWAGCVGLAAAVFLLVDRMDAPRALRLLALASLGAALCWGFVSYGLAGNWRFSFSGQAPGFRGSAEAARWFWLVSGLMAAPLAILGAAVVAWVIRTWRRS